MKNQKKLSREEMKLVIGGVAKAGCEGCSATEVCITLPDLGNGKRYVCASTDPI
nr:hypothetical protein [uncultured Mucilaginibacter sp.]